eukprot:13387227-Alexandrium_andersonii.AAC.1
MVEARRASHRDVEVEPDCPRLREGSRADLQSVDPAPAADLFQHVLSLAADHLHEIRHLTVLFQGPDHGTQVVLRMNRSGGGHGDLWVVGQEDVATPDAALLRLALTLGPREH